MRSVPLHEDCGVDIFDRTMLVDYLFISFDPIIPQFVADLNGDCEIDILDLTLFVDHLFISFGDLGVGCEHQSIRVQLNCDSDLSKWFDDIHRTF